MNDDTSPPTGRELRAATCSVHHHAITLEGSITVRLKLDGAHAGTRSAEPAAPDATAAAPTSWTVGPDADVVMKFDIDIVGPGSISVQVPAVPGTDGYHVDWNALADQAPRVDAIDPADPTPG